MVKITLEEPSQLVLKVNQMIRRAFSKKLGYELSHSRVLVGKRTENPNRPYEYVVSGYTQILQESFLVKTERIVEEGIYIVYIEMEWNDLEVEDFSLTVLAKKHKIEEVSSENKEIFLTECIKDFARNYDDVEM